jgi:hypothetical protein
VKRNLLVLAAVALLVVGGWPTLRLNRPDEKICRESFSRIHLDMSRADVENVIGLGPGFYKTLNITYFDEPFQGRRPAGATSLLWQGNDADIEVWFDAGGHVLAKKCNWRKSYVGYPGFVGQVRQWLGWH